MHVLIGLLVCVTLLIHLACAVAVALDSAKVAAAQQPLWPFGRGLWILTVLATGLIGATCYWVVHMSRITRVDRLALAPDEPAPVKPSTRADEAQLSPELQRIQQRLAKRGEDADATG